MSEDRLTATEIMLKRQEARDLARRTAEFISSLPAGPELDRLVAEKVMGWRPHVVAGSLATGWDTDGWRRMSFEPSTNIAHAWEVVERMRSMGLIVEIQGQTNWYACVERPNDDVWVRQAWADTAPLAICRAALMAVGAP